MHTLVKAIAFGLLPVAAFAADAQQQSQSDPGVQGAVNELIRERNDAQMQAINLASEVARLQAALDKAQAALASKLSGQTKK